MADKILRPRRGLRETAIRKGIILKKGEIFFEVPESGVGTGRTKIKLGDGFHKYEDLPYAIDPDSCGIDDLNKTVLKFEESNTKSDEKLLEEIKSGNSMGTIMGAIKTLLKNLSLTVKGIDDKLVDVAEDSKLPPENHASKDKKYGIATADLYGHVKLSSDIDNLPKETEGLAMSLEAGNRLYNMMTEDSMEFQFCTEEGEDLLTEDGEMVIGEIFKNAEETKYATYEQYGVVKLGEDLFGFDADDHVAASMNALCKLYQMIINRRLDIMVLTESGDPLTTESGANILGEVIL